MTNLLYLFSSLSILLSITSIIVSYKASNFEGGAGYASVFLFMISSLFSIAVLVMLYRYWQELNTIQRAIGIVGIIPLVVMICTIFYVVFIA